MFKNNGDQVSDNLKSAANFMNNKTQMTKCSFFFFEAKYTSKHISSTFRKRRLLYDLNVKEVICAYTNAD